MKTALWLTVALALTGCSAKLNGGVVNGTDDPAGIRYRVARPYETRIYYSEDNGMTVKSAVKLVYLPDPAVLREINYLGAFARSYNFKVNLRDNGTLNSVTLAAQGDSQAGQASEKLAEAIKAARDARDPTLREKQKLDQENALLQARKLNRELRQELNPPAQ